MPPFNAGETRDVGHEARGGKRTEATAGGGQAALDLASQGILLLDTKWRITGINAAAVRLLQCGQQSLAGRNFWDAVPRHIAQQHLPLTAKAIVVTGQHAFTAHHEFEDCWLEYRFRRNLAGFEVNLTDVTPLWKLQGLLDRSQRHNQLIFDASPNAMWVYDAASTRILAANQAAVNFYGIPHQAFLTLGLGVLFPDGEGASLVSTLGHSQGQGDTHPAPHICKQKKADGELVLVELACGWISWHDQMAVLVSVADVTKRHLADRELRRENADLELKLATLQGDIQNARRDLTAFTHALSNDLQGPLHAANGFATMLADKHADALDGTGLHYVDRIQANIRQLARLVDDLRTLVRLPQLPWQIEQLDLADTAGPLLDDLRKQHPDRLVTVEMEPSQSLMADRSLFVIALGCLLDNAWKFTSRKEQGWIQLALLPGKRPGEVMLQVSDNGTGFDAAYTDKLYTAFQRLHSSADFPGNGLGLAIVKGVADRHGGRAWAETGQAGASFFMAFPQDQADVS
jgi:PAS domain S-box-containing protein